MTYRLQRISARLLLVLGVAAKAAVVDLPADCQKARVSASTSPSFFRPRNISTDSTYELALANYNQFHHHQRPSECNNGSASLYVRPFYQQSFYGAQTARYFTPGHLETFKIAPNGLGCVDPVWLQLVTFNSFNNPAISYQDYFSTVSFQPIAQRYGAIFTANFFPSVCTFFNVNFALVEAKNDLRVIEDGRVTDPDVNLIETNPPLYRTFCQATNNTLATAGFADGVWTAGRIACQKLKTLGVDDVQLKLGRNFVMRDRGHLLGFLMMTVPTGKASLFTSRADACPKYKGCYITPTQGSQYLFQPLVGSRNWSFGGGLNGDVVLMQHEDRALWCMFEAKYNYYFRATERRSFDLTANGDWSRYLLLQTQTSGLTVPTPIPAINVFTMDASVRPGSQFQIWTAMHYQLCQWEFEAGYNLWYRQQEKVCLPARGGCGSTFPANTYGILDAYDTDGIYTSSSTSTIWLSDLVPSDATFTPVSLSDLNPLSAAHPRTASSKFYGSVGYSFNQSKPASVFLGINGSVELAHNYAAMNNWGAWATAALIF